MKSGSSNSNPDGNTRNNSSDDISIRNEAAVPIAKDAECALSSYCLWS